MEWGRGRASGSGEGGERESEREREREGGREVDDRDPQGNISTDQPFRFAHPGGVAG